MMQLGDLVCCSSWRQFPPRHIRGEVIKVNPKTVIVRWMPEPPRLNGYARLYYYRGGVLRQVPETSRKAHHNLELIERKGGPW